MDLDEVRKKVEAGEIDRAKANEQGWLFSVTQCSTNIKQPRGGYLRPADFDRIQLDGGGIEALAPKENIGPGLVGTAVDYLVRRESGNPVQIAFLIPYQGAEKIEKTEQCIALMKKVKGLDDDSIVSALRLTGFDVCKRGAIELYRPVEDIDPDQDTINNVREMVRRSIDFLEQYGPKTLDGFTFEGGYTFRLAYGDGDFLTEDTLWDFKVSKNEPYTKYTLQLLLYWRMGLHSVHPEFKDVEYLGIYNPRMNVVYRLPVSSIPAETIDEVEHEIIGYEL